MPMTVQEFFFGQTVYAQTRDPVVSTPSITPKGITPKTPQLPSVDPFIAINLAREACTNQGKPRDVSKKECFQTCPNGYTEKDGVKQNTCLKNTAGDLGIQCSPVQLTQGTCSRNINKTLGIRSSETTSSPTLLLQDVVLSATSFVGTLIMIALVVMGMKYIRGGYDESATGDLKGNIKKLLIGLFLVVGSYTMIRLIQYIARGY